MQHTVEKSRTTTRPRKSRSDSAWSGLHRIRRTAEFGCAHPADCCRHGVNIMLAPTRRIAVRDAGLGGAVISRGLDILPNGGRLGAPDQRLRRRSLSRSS